MSIYVSESNLEEVKEKAETLLSDLNELKEVYSDSVYTIERDLSNIDYSEWEDAISTQVQNFAETDITKAMTGVQTDLESKGFASMIKIAEAIVKQMEYCIEAKTELDSDKERYQNFESRYNTEIARYNALKKPSQAYVTYIRNLENAMNTLAKDIKTLTAELQKMITNAQNLFEKFSQVKYGDVVTNLSIVSNYTKTTIKELPADISEADKADQVQETQDSVTEDSAVQDSRTGDPAVQDSETEDSAVQDSEDKDTVHKLTDNDVTRYKLTDEEKAAVQAILDKNPGMTVEEAVDQYRNAEQTGYQLTDKDVTRYKLTAEEKAAVQAILDKNPEMTAEEAVDQYRNQENIENPAIIEKLDNEFYMAKYGDTTVGVFGTKADAQAALDSFVENTLNAPSAANTENYASLWMPTNHNGLVVGTRSVSYDLLTESEKQVADILDMSPEIVTIILPPEAIVTGSGDILRDNQPGTPLGEELTLTYHSSDPLFGVAHSSAYSSDDNEGLSILQTGLGNVTVQIPKQNTIAVLPEKPPYSIILPEHVSIPEDVQYHLKAGTAENALNTSTFNSGKYTRVSIGADIYWVNFGKNLCPNMERWSRDRILAEISNYDYFTATTGTNPNIVYTTYENHSIFEYAHVNLDAKDTTLYNILIGSEK